MGTLKRLFWISVGVVLAGLAIFRRTIDGAPIPLWRRTLVVAGGLFFIYCGAMYYLPKYRRRRSELEALLDEKEREP